MLSCWFGIGSGLAQDAPRYNYWLENQGDEVLVRESASASGIICSDLRSGERLQLIGKSPSYYKVAVKRGNCSDNLGWVRKGSPGLRLLRSKVQAIQPEPPVVSPANEETDRGEAANGKTPEEPAKNVWQDRFGLDARYYLGGKGGISFGVQALKETQFLFGVEFGYTLWTARSFLVALTTNYFTSGRIEVNSSSELDVSIISVALAPQYWFGFGEDIPYFLIVRSDVGAAFAFGNFATGLEDIFDTSLLVRPAAGVGFRSQRGNLIYTIDSGFNYMPFGFGFTAASVDAVFTVQYWF